MCSAPHRESNQRDQYCSWEQRQQQHFHYLEHSFQDIALERSLVNPNRAPSYLTAIKNQVIVLTPDLQEPRVSKGANVRGLALQREGPAPTKDHVGANASDPRTFVLEPSGVDWTGKAAIHALVSPLSCPRRKTDSYLCRLSGQEVEIGRVRGSEGVVCCI